MYGFLRRHRHSRRYCLKSLLLSQREAVLKRNRVPLQTINLSLVDFIIKIRWRYLGVLFRTSEVNISGYLFERGTYLREDPDQGIYGVTGSVTYW